MTTTNSDVYLPSFGVYLQSASLISSLTAVDMTDKLQEAINKAKELGVALDTGIRSVIGPAPSGYIYVTKSFDVTGLIELKGSLPIGVIPETFSATMFTAETPKRGIVMRNMNARYDANGKQYAFTTSGGQTFDSHGVYGLRDMPENVVGMVHTTSYSHFNGPVWGRRFSTAIMLANTYDVSIAAQWAVVDSGSKNYPAFFVGSYPYADVPDESNSVTFPRLLLHTNKYRDAELIGSKINVNAVHAEDCTIGTISGITPRGFDQFTPNGIASLVFAVTGGSIGNINYNINSESINNGCLLINALGTSVGSIYCDRGSIDTLVSDVYYLGRGGAVNNIYTAGSLYTDGGSKIVINSAIVGNNLINKSVHSLILRTDVTGDVINSGTIDYMVCKGNFTQDQYAIINGGQIYGVTTISASSEITNVTFNGEFSSSATLPRLRRCTFNGAFTNTGGGRFDNCTIPKVDIKSVINKPTYIDCNIGNVTAGTANGKAIFRNCSIGSYNFDSGNQLMVRILDGSCGTITMNNITSSLIIIDGVSCSSGNAIAGWTIPVGTGVGFGTKTINPYTASGWVLINNNGIASWKPI